jgi:hypothetical protein
LHAWWDTRGVSQMGMYQIDRWIDLRASFLELYWHLSQIRQRDEDAEYIDEMSNQKRHALFVC